MATARTQPRIVKAAEVTDPRRAAALDPHYNWKRALAAPGQRAVDFEERVNFRRLHDYRLARARPALGRSDLGAMLCFDTNNIRYLSSTVIGEWARDKMIRFALLAADAEPYVWDFGSAVKHHQLYSPWLPHDHCRAGMPGLRGAIPPEAGLMRMHAEEIKSLLKEHGVERMPLGIDLAEPAMLFELQRAGLEVRDCQQVMLEARELKSIDEIMLLNTAAAMVDGVYHMIAEKLKPGVRESDLVAEANRMLYQLGSDDVEAINAISGERCSPHPHNFTDRIIRPGDQAFFDIMHSFVGYRTCYYRTFSVGRATPAQQDAYKRAREWIDNALALVKPGVRSDHIAECWPKASDIGFSSEMEAFGLEFAHGLGLALHERPLISRLNSLKAPAEIKAGMVFALETYCPARDGFSAARIEEELVVTHDGCQVITH